MRGFWVRSATLNPATNNYDVVDGVKHDQPVLLDARVYNYSVNTPVSGIPVRFDLEPVDASNLATGQRFTVGTVQSGTIPFHGQTGSNDQVLPNYASVRLQLDTKSLLIKDDQLYRVWVVLNADDPGNTAGQTHGWRQPNVILTPSEALQAGTAVSVQLFDETGKSETISYTSQGDDDNIAAGLRSKLQSSTLVTRFGAKVSLQDTKTSTQSVVVFKDGAEPPDGDEYSAGIVEGAQELYLVPLPAQKGIATLTATNLEYGQNNEGWGMLKVNAASTPGPMLGGDDPCAISSLGAGTARAARPQRPAGERRRKRAQSARSAPACSPVVGAGGRTYCSKPGGPTMPLISTTYVRRYGQSI